MENMAKLRVKDLARELGLSSKELIYKLRNELDFQVNTADSTPDEKQTLLVKEFIKANKELSPEKIEEIIVKISNFRNIKKADLTIDFRERELKVITGENGVGKSSLLLCLGCLVMPTLFSKLKISDGDFEVLFELKLTNNEITQFYLNKNIKNWTRQGNKDGFQMKKIKGYFESSLEYLGSRRVAIDSVKDRSYLLETVVNSNELLEREEFLIENMNYILFGKRSGKFDSLVRSKERFSQDGQKFYYYGLKIGDNIIPESQFSAGEKFLLYILKFLQTFQRRPNEKRLLVIDEIDLSLHPFAQYRLGNFIENFVKEQKNLFVIVCTHSIPLIEAISNEHILLMKNKEGILSFEKTTSNYVSWIMYGKKNYKNMILVEDHMAKLLVKKILVRNLKFTDSLETFVLPIGGWRQVKEVYREHKNKAVLSSSNVIIALDGDVRKEAEKELKEALFLPFGKIEKTIVDSFVNGELKELEISFLSIDNLEEFKRSLRMKRKDHKKAFKTLRDKLAKLRRESKDRTEDWLLDILISKFSGEVREFAESLKEKLK
jgi:predicted ATPase